MEQFERSIRLAVLGWIVVACFGGFVALGNDTAANGAVFTLVAVAMASWVWIRRSRPALIVSIVLGGLHAVEQIFYTAGSIRDSDWVVLLADVFGFVGGVIVLTGSILALKSLQRSRHAV